MHTKPELLELLRAHGLRLTKRLGQHYLIDPRITTRLIEPCRLTAQDHVIEIGAGLGALTEALARQASAVVAVEIDRAVCEVLKSRLAHVPNVRVVCQDVLEFPWEQYPRSVVVGAIPYVITSPILVRLCECSQRVAAAWLGLQQEVAQRLLASPGTKAYGRLTLLVQRRFDVEDVMRIPRGAFFPMPQVDSRWIKLTPCPSRAGLVKEERLFSDVVRVAFSQRRKTLANCLEQLTVVRLTREEAAEAIRAAGLPERIRGEALSFEDFARLTNAISGS